MSQFVQCGECSELHMYLSCLEALIQYITRHCKIYGGQVGMKILIKAIDHGGL